MQRRAKVMLVMAGVVVLAAGGVAGVLWWVNESHAWVVPVPYLSFTYDEPIAKGIESVGGLVLHAHNDTRQAQEEGFIVYVANVSDKPVRFNTRPFRHAKGLGGWVEDTEGKQHPLQVQAVYPRGPFGSFVNLPEAGLPLCDAEMVTLKPGARFSISITFHAADIQRNGFAVDAVSTETLGRLYQVKNYTLCFAYVREEETAKDVWEGTLTSNTFKCDQKPQPRLTPTGFRQGSFPEHLFQEYYDRMRHSSREDVGRRLLIFEHFRLLQEPGVLRPGQFDRVLDWAVLDDSALMRMEAARYPRTWKNLLLDADRDVRRRALWNVAKRNAYPSHGEIEEIVSTIYLYGNAEERLLAIEAYSLHHTSGNQSGRISWDIIAKAKADPDEAVRKRAQELWANYPPLITVPF